MSTKRNVLNITLQPNDTTTKKMLDSLIGKVIFGQVCTTQAEVINTLLQQECERKTEKEKVGITETNDAVLNYVISEIIRHNSLKKTKQQDKIFLNETVLRQVTNMGLKSVNSFLERNANKTEEMIKNNLDNNLVDIGTNRYAFGDKEGTVFRFNGRPLRLKGLFADLRKKSNEMRGK